MACFFISSALRGSLRHVDVKGSLRLRLVLLVARSLSVRFQFQLSCSRDVVAVLFNLVSRPS